jgi:aspartate kinase
MTGGSRTFGVKVMKFGGSSLATPELRAAAVKRVVAARQEGWRVVVVCSAMGRYPDPYATDTLLSLAAGAAPGPNLDALLACGEMISCALFAELLAQRGVRAVALSGAQAGILTDGRHGQARVLRVETGLVQRLLETEVTPVVCGFQGVTDEGWVTTLGRGGSDLTAVVLARALGNACLEIYTDVEGVMTADPKRVEEARTLAALSFEEATELSEQGATVMHDGAADLARLARVPYAVRGLRTGVGTQVGQPDVVPAGPVTGIATAFGFTFFHVVPEAAVLPGGWERDALRVLAEAGISIDCVNVNSAGLFFIVRDHEADATRRLLDALPVAVRGRPGCAKISVVGAGMRGTPGVMFRCVQALQGAGVPIIHSTDSNITISLLVPGVQAATGEKALHDEFCLGEGRPAGRVNSRATPDGKDAAEPQGAAEAHRTAP